jgi:hypothetical protein
MEGPRRVLGRDRDGCKGGIVMLQPLASVQGRVDRAREDSDVVFFNDLMLLGELAVKLTVGGLVACVEQGRDRHRYRLEHSLVRASGIGAWATVGEEVLTGPASQELVPAAGELRTSLAKKRSNKEPEVAAVQLLNKVLSGILDQERPLPGKIALSRWLHDFAELRGPVRVHG